MEELGDMLIRLGPAFGVLFFVLVIGSAVAMLAIATVTLWQERRRGRTRDATPEEAAPEPAAAEPARAEPAPA